MTHRQVGNADEREGEDKITYNFQLGEFGVDQAQVVCILVEGRAEGVDSLHFRSSLNLPIDVASKEQ